MDNNGNHDNNWSGKTALWVIAAVIVVAFVFWGWKNGCNEQQATATAVANLNGRLNAIEPAITAQGNNLFALNGVVSATVQGVKSMKECFGEQLFELNDEVFYSRRNRGGCGCGNREFKQSSTYNLASTAVTVDETCRS